jgi:hypothetical protein
MSYAIQAVPEFPLSDRELIPRVSEALESVTVNTALFGEGGSRQKAAS